MPPLPHDLATLGCYDLRALADSLLTDPTPAVILDVIRFVEAETRGKWHGRARAMLCRRLKHCSLTRQQQSRLTDCILGRLRDGNFSEQYRDQLRLVLHYDPQSAFNAARPLLGSRKQHVRRYAQWVLDHQPIVQRGTDRCRLNQKPGAGRTS
jgi:hypothetical protein